MAYPKTTWTNGTSPAINATNLNKIEQGIYDASVLLDKNVSSQTTITSGTSEVSISVPSGKTRVKYLLYITPGTTRTIIMYLNGTDLAFSIPVTNGYFQIELEKVSNTKWIIAGSGDDSKADVFTVSNLSSLALKFPPGSGQSFASGCYYYTISNV